MKATIYQTYKEISHTQQVWVLHPGRNKIFYDDFWNQEKAFLELPGVELGPDFSLTDETKRELQKGFAIAQYYRQGAQGPEPSRNPEDYDPNLGLNDSENKSRMDTKFMDAAVGLFVKARKGDLILVPGRGYDTAVYVGEFSDNFDGSSRGRPTKYGGAESVPARNIEWLNHSLTKHNFPWQFTKKLQNQRALILLERSLKPIAYDYAYGDYILSDGSSVVVDVQPSSGPDGLVEQVDPLDQRAAQDLVIYYAALFNAIRSERAPEFFNLSIDEAIRSDIYALEPLGAEYEIHSPGKIIFRVKSSAKVGFIGAMLALTTPSISLADISDVEIANKWSIEPSSCDIEIRDSVRSAINHANADRWVELCELREKSTASIEVDTSSKVTLTEEVEEDDNGR